MGASEEGLRTEKSLGNYTLTIYVPAPRALHVPLGPMVTSGLGAFWF